MRARNPENVHPSAIKRGNVNVNAADKIDPEWTRLARRMGAIIRRVRENQGLSQLEVARRIVREDRGLSEDEFARRVALRQRQWSNWETAAAYGESAKATNNQSNLNIPNILLMERALGLPKIDLLKWLFAEELSGGIGFEPFVWSLDISDLLKDALIATHRAATEK